MLEHIEASGRNREEAERNFHRKCGNRKGQKTTYRNEYDNGFLGMFPRSRVVVSGYIVPQQTSASNYNSEYDRKQSDQYGSTSYRSDALDQRKRDLIETARESAGIQYHQQHNSNMTSEIMDQVLARIGDRFDEMEHKMTGVSPDAHHLESIASILKENDFSKPYIDWIITKIRTNFTLTALDDVHILQQNVMRWIKGNIATIDSKSPLPKFVALIGPTGVGKTTTVARLANFWRKAEKIDGEEQRPKKRICLVCLDNYRVMAMEHLQRYAELLDVPIKKAITKNELRDVLKQYGKYDHVLIDTEGRSPNDFKALGELNNMLQNLGCEIYKTLLLCAGVKFDDLINIMRQYEPFNYDSAIATKLDETNLVGNLLSALHQRNVPLWYIADGQGPDNFYPARSNYFIQRLSGFSTIIQEGHK